MMKFALLSFLLILNSVESKPTIDVYADQRYNYVKVNRIESINTVIFFGEDYKKQNISSYIFLRANTIVDNIFLTIGKEFMLNTSSLLNSQRYAIYVSGTGLNPYPSDTTIGIPAYANDRMMVVNVDILANIIRDPSVVIHELGHAYWLLPRAIYKLEESLSEYLVYYYLPSCRTIYDRTLSFMMNDTRKNIFSTSVLLKNPYDIAAFWAHIEFGYGRTLSKIVFNLRKSNSTVKDIDVWRIVSETFQKTEDIVITRWVCNLLEVSFFRRNKEMVGILSNPRSPLSKSSLVWNKVTTNNTSDINKLEKGGFEVFNYSKYEDIKKQFLNSTIYNALFINHYKDGTANVTRYNIFNNMLSLKLLVIIKIK